MIELGPMTETDVHTIASDYCPAWTSPEELREKWNGYYLEQLAGVRFVCLVRSGHELLGYGSLLLKSLYPYFVDIPEIHDVWIFERHRRQGLGRRLIAWLEEIAREKGYAEVGIGVGLCGDYGSAQKLYVQLGYVPDGLGVSYNYLPTIPGKSYPLDDELVLWLKKRLMPHRTP